MLKRITVIALAAFLLTGHSSADGKRSNPAPVPPVRVAAVEYRVSGMGFVEAYDTKAGDVLWSRQIYVVVKDPMLEGDVQDVFITRLQHERNALIITNERGFIYQLDLKSLEVTAIKGAVRVGR